MKTILVPTDFSNHALFALKVAASIAKRINAGIDLVHACHLASAGVEQYHYYYAEYNKENIKIANENLKKLINQKFLDGVKISKHIIVNKFMWEVVNDERFGNTDLIVMGSHGTSGFNNLFIGSNTNKIVRLAKPPVLTIKNEIIDFTIKKMVFASNFIDEAYPVFEKIKFFADIYNAHIDLLKVITPKNFESTPISQKLIKKFVKKFNLKNYSVIIYNAHNIEHGIIDFTDKIDADMIAIETHGRTGLAHLINGSLAEDVIKDETIPVLSIKMQQLSAHGSLLSSYNKNYEVLGSE